MGSISIQKPIAGGGTVDLPLTRMGVTHASSDDVEVKDTSLMYQPVNRKVYFAFSFIQKIPFPMKRITVEDISDDTPVTMLDVSAPKVDTRTFMDPTIHKEVTIHLWAKTTPEFTATPENIPWLMELDFNIRIYRISIYKSDGTTETLISGQEYGPPIKTVMRIALKLQKP
ncbi:MAG TPA: hypothetical protein VGL42_09850 [Opitutaceae bacterium]|jgi:hypothetical protein